MNDWWNGWFSSPTESPPEVDPLIYPGQIHPVQHSQYGLGYTVTTGSNSLQNSQSNAFQQGLSNGGVLAQGAWTNINVQQMPKTLRNVITAHLATPVFETKIDDLVNAWLAKFGDGWIKRDEIFKAEDPEFFELAAQRMMKCGRLEEHTLMDTMEVVYRVVEK